MSDIEIRLDQTGITDALKATDPKLAYEIIELWYLRATDYVKRELQTRAPGRLKGKVRVRFDNYKPHRWARIFVASPIAHLIEAGTGRLGAPPFVHKARHWPSTAAIMESTGLPKQQAFLVARKIGLRGGNLPKPFLQPTWTAVTPRVMQMADEAAAQVLK